MDLMGRKSDDVETSLFFGVQLENAWRFWSC